MKKCKKEQEKMKKLEGSKDMTKFYQKQIYQDKKIRLQKLNGVS